MIVFPYIHYNVYIHVYVCAYAYVCKCMCVIRRLISQSLYLPVYCIIPKETFEKHLVHVFVHVRTRVRKREVRQLVSQSQSMPNYTEKDNSKNILCHLYNMLKRAHDPKYSMSLTITNMVTQTHHAQVKIRPRGYLISSQVIFSNSKQSYFCDILQFSKLYLD